MHRAIRLFAASLLATLAGCGACAAQSYPSRTVQLVVAYAAGGTGDVVARLISGKLSTALGQSVVVENRAGASGAVGTQSVIQAAPDGHILLVGQTAEVAINQNRKGIGYDPDKDLIPIALAAVVPLVLVAPREAPWSDVGALLSGLSSSKKDMTFASAGIGTPGHFAGELLKLKTRGNLVHVPYKGAGPALNDVLGGHVDLYFPGFPAVLPHRKAGTLKLLAVSSAQRAAAAPDLPTMAEALGSRDFEFTLWVGFFAPRRTPGEIVSRLNRDINAILQDPETRAKLQEAGADVTPLSLDQTTAFVKAESEKYVRVIRETGIVPE